MATREAIEVPGMKAPGLYSQAVRAMGFLSVSGRTGLDAATGAADPDFEAHARQAFQNVVRVVRPGGVSIWF
jgi:enamine deaminase RidA (YjgF/YER057c/UK114 family)